MKQEISVDQLMELTDNQKNNLFHYWYMKYPDQFSEHAPMERVTADNGLVEFMIPRLNIGQCIELLEAKIKDTANCRLLVYKFPDGLWNVETIDKNDLKWGDDHIWIKEVSELIDALWQAVKEVL